MGVALNFFFCLLSVAFSFRSNAPVSAICLVCIIIIPKITLHSFVSAPVPRSPVNKFLSIDQGLVTCPTTDDTYPLALFVFAPVPSVLFSQNILTFSVSLTALAYFPAVPSFQAILQHSYSSRFHLLLYFLSYLHTYNFI